MKAVVLCAGTAKRLMPLTGNLPKQLLPLNSETIIEFLLDRVLRCGIMDIVMVVGFKQKMLKEMLGTSYRDAHITYVTNDEYGRTNTLYSVWLAHRQLKGHECIIINGDILCDYRIIKKMVDAVAHRTTAAVDDSKKEWPDEANGFTLEEGYITKVSKDIPASESSGAAIGIYMLSAEASTLYFNELERLLNDKQYDEGFIRNQYYQFAFNTIAGQLKMRPVSSGGMSWIEVDDQQEYEQAKEIIKNIKRDESRSDEAEEGTAKETCEEDEQRRPVKKMSRGDRRRR